MNERIRKITGQVLDELVPQTWTTLGYDQIKEIQYRTAELVIAGKAQCFYEALQPEFKDYAKQVRLNADAMAETFTAAGVDIVSGGTQCHMFTIDLRNQAMSGREYADLLEKMAS